jgi:PAS domain S-box-containing protein
MMTIPSIQVLLVEDDEDDYLLTRDLLEEIEGVRFNLDWERNYDAGLAQMHQRRHDVYLVDYRLDGRTGLDLIRQALSEGVRAPFILLTGQGDHEIDLEAMRSGAADFLIKGQFESPLLERSIRYAIQQARTLEALRQSKEFAERILDSSVDGIFAFDRSMRLTLWNPGMEQITGVKRDRAAGELAFNVMPCFLESGEERFFHEALEGRTAEGKDRPYHVPATGRRGSFESRYSPLRSDGGEVIGGLAIIRDITERKRLEEQFQHSQRLEAVGRLAGGVAHDFNNLLTAITGYSELLLNDRKNDRELCEQVEEIHKAARRAAALTSQLLTFSRHRATQSKVLVLSAVIAETEKMLRRVIGEDIELVVRGDRQNGCVRADRGQLEQVVMNLAVNARDAMPKGGKLTITTESQHLVPPCSAEIGVPPGDFLVLSVADTGQGMSPHTLSHVFEPFFTTKEPDKGTGLGLSTVYGIIQRGGGHIRIASELGKGTTFTIYLPRVFEAPDSLESRQSSAAAAGEGETILLVEDQETVRRLVGKILRMNGYCILEASEGSEAIRQTERHDGPIHLLVTDMVMPRMTGGVLARQLQARRPEMRILFVSGYASENIDDPAMMNLAPEHFLQKPFTMEELTRKVRALLDQPVDRGRAGSASADL